MVVGSFLIATCCNKGMLNIQYNHANPNRKSQNIFINKSRKFLIYNMTIEVELMSQTSILSSKTDVWLDYRGSHFIYRCL